MGSGARLGDDSRAQTRLIAKPSSLRLRFRYPHENAARLFAQRRTLGARQHPLTLAFRRQEWHEILCRKRRGTLTTVHVGNHRSNNPSPYVGPFLAERLKLVERHPFKKLAFCNFLGQRAYRLAERQCKTEQEPAAAVL